MKLTMDMFVTFINEPLVNAELVKSLDIDSGNLQPDNILFGKILSNLLGTLKLQQSPLEIERNTLLPETKGSKIISLDSNNRGISPYLSSVFNKDNEHISSESDLVAFPSIQEQKGSDYHSEDIYQIIALSKKIFCYFLQSGDLPVNLEEQPEQYIHKLNNNKNNSAPSLNNEIITNDFVSKDLQVFKTCSPDIKENLKFINFINMDKNEADLSDSVSFSSVSKDSQILKTPLMSSIREVIQFLNTEKAEVDLTQRYHPFIIGSHMSDLEVSSHKESGNGEKGLLEKDVIPVFIREIKSFLDDANVKPLATEETLTIAEDIAHGEISKDKGHEQMSNFNNPSGTENAFFRIEDSNLKTSKDFQISDKTIILDDKQNNLYTVSKNGDASIEISIEPDGIGEVDIEFVLDKGVINAQINTSDTLGKEFFEKNLDNIMKALINEGLNIGNFSVSLQNKRGMAMYENNKEDIKDVCVANLNVLPVPLRNEGLISIFV